MFQSLKNFLNHGGVSKVAAFLCPVLGYTAHLLPDHTVGFKVLVAASAICGTLFASSNPTAAAVPE